MGQSQANPFFLLCANRGFSSADLVASALWLATSAVEAWERVSALWLLAVVCRTVVVVSVPWMVISYSQSSKFCHVVSTCNALSARNSSRCTLLSVVFSFALQLSQNDAVRIDTASRSHVDGTLQPCECLGVAHGLFSYGFDNLLIVNLYCFAGILRIAVSQRGCNLGFHR